MNFTNHFLISMPHMADVFFNKSIIYICEHTIDGAMGIIITKDLSDNKKSLILKETGLNNVDSCPKIYFGGPVQMTRGIILHSCDYVNEDSKIVTKNLSITSNEEILDDMSRGKGPDKFRFTFGYAGWGSNQLEREFENGDWLLLPANNGFIFDTPDEKKWEEATGSIGIDILNISGTTGIS